MAHVPFLLLLSALQGTKLNLNYTRDHPVRDGLEWAQLWNMSMLQVGLRVGSE